MTIKLLTDWPYKRADNAGYHRIPAGSIVSVFDAGTEAAMIVAKTAEDSSDSVTWTVPSEAPIHTAPTAEVVSDGAGLTMTEALANTQRSPTGALTYTITASTAWAVGDGMLVYLPASGTISFAVSGGATINGGTTTLTRALAGNGAGIVALSRIQGANAYGLTGA